MRIFNEKPTNVLKNEEHELSQKGNCLGVLPGLPLIFENCKVYLTLFSEYLKKGVFF